MKQLLVQTFNKICFVVPETKNAKDTQNKVLLKMVNTIVLLFGKFFKMELKEN
jgi:hypothetical protein